MSYLVIARKFRPQSFADVTGQEHVTRTLANAIARNKVGHAYLFAGPRGVGKTSIARIFSKCLNCEKGPTSAPCLNCSQCTGIAQGTNLAVREIDGASHNSVDNVRELIESFRMLPPGGSRYKIYIIDEVHMLSASAFNALLKSLEEPPPHTVFILATTEAHKIPETVLSRCQRHDLRALTLVEVEKRLREVCAAENIQIEDAAVRLIARLAEGSMRDSQSLLDRVQSYCEGAITGEDTGRVLGVVSRENLWCIVDAILRREPQPALSAVADSFNLGIDPSLFLREFVLLWRELLIAKSAAAEGLKKVGLSADEIPQYLEKVASASSQDIQDLAALAREGADNAMRSSYPQYAVEALVVRMATRERVRDLALLIEALQQSMKRGVPSSGAAAGAASSNSMPEVVRSGSAREAAAPGSAPSSAAVTRSPQSSPPRAAGVGQVAGASASAAAPQGDGPQIVRKRELRWEDFVSDAKSGLSSVFVEQLKRISVTQYGSGTLKGSGPEFTISYLAQSENKAKLEGLLAKVTGIQTWKIEFATVGSKGSPVEGSILHDEVKVAEESRREKERDIASHPKIKSLQRVFPGSVIENIRIKE